MHNVMIANPVLIVLSVVVIAFFFREAFRLDKTGRNKMFVAFILMIEAVLFYILYAQMPTSLNFFAINNVHHQIPVLPSTRSVSSPEPLLGGGGQPGAGGDLHPSRPQG